MYALCTALISFGRENIYLASSFVLFGSISRPGVSNDIRPQFWSNYRKAIFFCQTSIATPGWSVCDSMSILESGYLGNRKCLLGTDWMHIFETWTGRKTQKINRGFT